MRVKLISDLLIILFYIQFLIICVISKNKNAKKFDYRREYSENSLSKVHSQYLLSNPSDICKQPGTISEISDQDFNRAVEMANKQISQLKKFDQDYSAKDQRSKEFNQFLHQANYQAKLNELITKNLMDIKCLSKSESVLKLRNCSHSHKLANNQYSDIGSDVSPTVKCDPKSKYRSIDGKCNNLLNTNWGSSFHCQRRLLPPDYKDGVSQLRASTDGSPLPNARLLSKYLMREKASLSQYSLLHTMWGQFLAHDTFLRVLYFGGALDCCASQHSECLQIDNIPRDNLSIAYNQNCINLMRALSCNTCNLGHRNHINQVTSFLDLSQIYGFNKNISDNLRTFKEGQLKSDRASDKSEVLAKADSGDKDIYELGECTRPVDRPTLSCFKSGDLNRGNQNPAGTALEVILIRRHNQHTRGLAKVNPSWNDERLFQEARRLLIAEYNRINFGEYLPTILSRKQMRKFDLNVKRNNFSKYNSNVNPSGIQSVGGAAFRFGHLTTTGTFLVHTTNAKSFSFKLRDKYGEMSDIWDGRTNGIIRGLTETPEKQMVPNVAEDLSDHLFMDKNHPDIKDLAAFNIQRGRDYGLPGYVYYVQYLSGTQIKGWDDLKRYIPDKYLEKLKNVYKDYKDIDLYVGGVLENKLSTFRKLIGIQYYHWKFGDRFYFEHTGQSGSFTKDQLNNIRKTVSMANLLCKTTDFQSINSKPFSIPSKSNQNMFCNKMPEINYKLFRG